MMMMIELMIETAGSKKQIIATLNNIAQLLEQ
jgi:hypothetical protein